MTNIEKLNKILSNNGRLFKIFFSPNEEKLCRITDDLKIEKKVDGQWLESVWVLSDLLKNPIILVKDDYTDEQKEICGILYKIGYRYIAKNENEQLYAFVEYPHKNFGDWDTEYVDEPKCFISYNFDQIGTNVPIALLDIFEENTIQ